jgi:hypothetical protein
MRKIIYSLLGVAFLFSACEDRLDIEQKGVISFDSFYKTDDDAQNALNNLYQSFCLNIAGNEGIYVALPLLFDEAGDDMLAAGNMYGDNDFGAQINEFRYDSQNEVIKNTYWGLYGVIYDCNLILDNIEPTTSIKKRVCAEARTLRAKVVVTIHITCCQHIISSFVKKQREGHINTFITGYIQTE